MHYWTANHQELFDNLAVLLLSLGWWFSLPVAAKFRNEQAMVYLCKQVKHTSLNFSLKDIIIIISYELLQHPKFSLVSKPKSAQFNTDNPAQWRNQKYVGVWDHSRHSQPAFVEYDWSIFYSIVLQLCHEAVINDFECVY